MYFAIPPAFSVNSNFFQNFLFFFGKAFLLLFKHIMRKIKCNYQKTFLTIIQNLFLLLDNKHLTQKNSPPLLLFKKTPSLT